MLHKLLVKFPKDKKKGKALKTGGTKSITGQNRGGPSLEQQSPTNTDQNKTLCNSTPVLAIGQMSVAFSM